MMAPAAEALGVRLAVLAESEDACAVQAIAESTVGDYKDLETVRAFAAEVDVVTFDHEHVPTEILRTLEAEGVAVRPGAAALVHAQDKLVMRARMDEIGLPNPQWAQVTSVEDLRQFGDRVGWPVVLKTPRGGYDGKGVMVASRAEDGAEWLETATGSLLAEEKVPFARELAVMVGRSPMGQTATWPVVQTWQRDGICKEAIAPAPGLDPGLAAKIAADVISLATRLDVTGVMAMEMFLVEEDGRQRYLVNELAMRPHNTGHWTQDGSVTSQFEQHLRAVLDLPLGETSAQFPASVMVNVLGGEYEDLYGAYRHVMAHDPAIKVHMYGKSVRPGRKVGHVNAVGEDVDALLERARHAADYFEGTVTS
ncbi:5-(carboxyamino)imidazole ribonucleotide synthase [Sediminivirga luteola]|uniref:5-(carboxyamino)imidazole ribonucleotide synthase n=1 Tax=Sediminivirga luteola TaxID=1774748 RepID=UPI001F5A176D|nr:5-(carboxyamino)imidazole ribonucleotide synthase [Sediminivirga luteola]MCI2265578.1 5-(carboxyamino)imidazole ribonucleotide synthase [Sediminivirga luteola]